VPPIYKQTEEQKAERRREASRLAYAKRKAELAAADSLRERAGQAIAQGAGSRVVLDDDDDSHLPATPSYLAEQARKRAARAATPTPAEHRAASAAQEAEALRIIEQAANGELAFDSDSDDDSAQAQVTTHAAVDTLKPRARCGDKGGRAWSRLSTEPTCERCRELLAADGPTLLDEYKAREADKRERTLRIVLPREESLSDLQRRTDLSERDARAHQARQAEREELQREMVEAAHPDEEISKAQLVSALEVLVISSRRKARRAREQQLTHAHTLESGITEGLQIALQLISDLLAD
jgi:hypothetical protein